MPISYISTILIHNHAPVLENAANIKNAGKQHFAGVLANNRNQSYFIGVFLQTTLIVQNFSNCINRINIVNTRVRVTHYMIFGKHTIYTIYPIPVNTIYSTIHIIPNKIHYNYIDITILLSYCKYL